MISKWAVSTRFKDLRNETALLPRQKSPGSAYSMSIDMWSLGCILCELYTGSPLFPGEDENEQLACIMSIIGLPEESFLQRCNRRKTFFGKDGFCDGRMQRNSKSIIPAAFVSEIH